MLLGMAALATPALADVSVTGTTTKTETITIDEDITKAKVVVIAVAQTFTGSTAAEATSVYNQRNNGNILTRDYNSTAVPASPNAPTCTVCGPTGPAADVATMTNSFSNNTGVVLWNQDVGNNANQANAVTVAVVANAFFAEATASAEQRTEGNQSFVFGFFPTVTKSSLIANSVNNNTGVTMINQNAGFASNQYNNLTAAIGLNGGTVALADADLGQWNQGNVTVDFNSTRSGTIVGSVTGNTGVTAVNQNNGNFNNQATMISFSGGH
jgi:hypothetical protein